MGTEPSSSYLIRHSLFCVYMCVALNIEPEILTGILLEWEEIKPISNLTVILISGDDVWKQLRKVLSRKKKKSYLPWKRLEEPLKKDEAENSTIASLRILNGHLYLILMQNKCKCTYCPRPQSLQSWIQNFLKDHSHNHWIITCLSSREDAPGNKRTGKGGFNSISVQQQPEILWLIYTEKGHTLRRWLFSL